MRRALLALCYSRFGMTIGVQGDPVGRPHMADQRRGDPVGRPFGGRQFAGNAALALALVLAVAVLGCQAPPAASGPQESRTPDPPVPEEARPLVDLAKSDLSQRAGIPVEQIRLVSLEEVDWPNGSLGFPKPGMVYMQVIIEGYRVILTDGARNYEYHSDRGRRVEHAEP